MYKESRQTWLEKMTRKNLDAYINTTKRLLIEAEKEKNEHNINIYTLWLTDAIFESNRRIQNKNLYLDKFKKSSRF